MKFCSFLDVFLTCITLSPQFEHLSINHHIISHTDINFSIRCHLHYYFYFVNYLLKFQKNIFYLVSQLLLGIFLNWYFSFVLQKFQGTSWYGIPHIFISLRVHIQLWQKSSFVIQYTLRSPPFTHLGIFVPPLWKFGFKKLKFRHEKTRLRPFKPNFFQKFWMPPPLKKP